MGEPKKEISDVRHHSGFSFFATISIVLNLFGNFVMLVDRFHCHLLHALTFQDLTDKCLSELVDVKTYSPHEKIDSSQTLRSHLRRQCFTLSNGFQDPIPETPVSPTIEK